MPAKMKNFFDVNFNAGFGFKYTPEGLRQLLKGKRARFFMTADGPDFLYLVYKPILKYITIGGFLYHYCGIKIASVHVFANMFKNRTDKDRTRMITRVEQIARRK
jgi:putative NADPH-quinone reductase